MNILNKKESKEYPKKYFDENFLSNGILIENLQKNKLLLNSDTV